VVTPVKEGWRWSALLGVLGLVMVCFIGTTVAVFVDIEAAYFEVEVTVPPGLRPVASHMAATTLAIDGQGRAVIWGYRGHGISGTGVDSVADDAAASVVALPEGRRIVLLTGGTQDGDEVSDYSYVVALDDLGQIWTWGCGTEKTSTDYMCGRTISAAAPRNKPGRVDLPDRVVDLKASTPTTVVLTAGGEVWTWGNDYHGSAGVGYDAIGTPPRRILTGIHSIGTGYWAGWAVAASGWTYTTYKGTTFTSDPQPQGGLLFWGWQSTGQSGGPAGDGRSAGYYYTPSLVKDDSELSKALAAGTAAGDDNVTLGVRAGSPDDKGTFQQMTGSFYGNQFRLRDGSVFLWGSRSNYAAGTDASTGSISAYLAQHVTLQHLGLSVSVVQIATTVNLIFLLDSTGTVWMYGQRNGSPNYPDANGAYQSTSASDVRLPMRIDGGAAHPAWKAGDIVDIVGMGYTVAVRHANGAIWMVGKNTHCLVRDDIWSNTCNTSDQPPVKVDYY
jgi:hypothetical protein